MSKDKEIIPSYKGNKIFAAGIIVMLLAPLFGVTGEMIGKVPYLGELVPEKSLAMQLISISLGVGLILYGNNLKSRGK